MALCTTTGPFGLLSGAFADRSAAAGVVANPTAGRNTLRQYVIPANPATPAQVGARSRFISAVNSFSTLNQSEIDPWRDLADAITRTGRLGLPYTPSAANMFIAVNTLRLLDGQVLETTPPALEILEALDPDTFELEWVAGPPEEANINWTDSLPAGAFVVVRITRALPTASRLGRQNELILASLPAASILLSSTETLAASISKISASLGSYHGLQIQSVSSGYLPGKIAFVPQLQFAAP